MTGKLLKILGMILAVILFGSMTDAFTLTAWAHPEYEYEVTAADLRIEEYRKSIDILAYCTMAEAGNQGEMGKRLVIDCILNRVESPFFPGDTIEDVIRCPGQFEVVSRGTLYAQCPTQDIYELAQEEILHRTNREVVYFKLGGFHSCGDPWQQVGAHFFSKISRRWQT